MKADSQVLYPNLHEWQRNLLEELLRNHRSGNQPPVFRHHRRQGKSWIQRWLNENASLNSKLSERSSVLPPRITKADINTLAQKNKPSISVGSSPYIIDTKQFIIFDELSYPVDEELIQKLRQITDKMKNPVAETPKSEYNIYINSE